jgi:fermentation-respiration switch protein FrsA (DUF1100 family)
MMLMERVPYGIDLARVRPMDAAREIRRPALFIHGRDDELVDASDSVRLFEAVGVEDKELWTVPDATHAGSYWEQPKEYAARVQEFLSRAFRQTR